MFLYRLLVEGFPILDLDRLDNDNMSLVMNVTHICSHPPRSHCVVSCRVVSVSTFFPTSLGLTVYEVATRMELPGDGEDWHTMRDGRACGLPSSRSQELGAVVRQVGVEERCKLLE